MEQLALTSPRIKKGQIKTVADLDLYRWQKPIKAGKYPPKAVIKSRYATLVDLYGERAAGRTMRELEIAAWDMPKGLK